MNGVLMTCWRATVRFANDRMRLAIVLTQPALWLTFMGNILDQATSRIPQVHQYLQGAPTYLSYMAPGLIVLGSAFSSAYCGIFIFEDRASGFFQKLLAAPLPRASIPYGIMLAGALQNLLQAIVFIATARLFGVSFMTGFNGILVILAIATALNLAFSALLLMLAALLRSSQEYVAILSCLALPAVFTSTVVLPTAFMPQWMARISAWNPLSHAVAPVRRLVNVGWIWHELHVGLAVTIGLALVLSVAVAAFYRRPRAA
jgi:ABC-2 type transport system permease protein